MPTVLMIFFIVIIADPVNAYIGPGIGAGAISVALGIVGSIIVALFAILWYPFKRLLIKRKKRKLKDSVK